MTMDFCQRVGSKSQILSCCLAMISVDTQYPDNPRVRDSDLCYPRPADGLSLLFLCVAFLICGCNASPKATYSTQRPSSHTVSTKSFVIQSDIKLSPSDGIAKALETVETQVRDTLDLPEPRDIVNVYLFSDEASYRFYMHTTWKDLPPRRAYFVGTSRELAVYSFISPQVIEDLRHEFTHGVLHATLQTVPLWLDEGLAEYFEIPSDTPGAAHAAHLQELQQARSEDWNPNLYRLESMSDFKDMSERDYAEAWAWTHFMLNNSEDSAAVLKSYLGELRETKLPRRIQKSLESKVPSYFTDMPAHIANLQAAHKLAGM
ncbi:MAG: DUF1570 domain-containing protein [Planctomycetota bacterium]